MYKPYNPEIIVGLNQILNRLGPNEVLVSPSPKISGNFNAEFKYFLSDIFGKNYKISSFLTLLSATIKGLEEKSAIIRHKGNCRNTGFSIKKTNNLKTVVAEISNYEQLLQQFDKISTTQITEFLDGYRKAGLIINDKEFGTSTPLDKMNSNSNPIPLLSNNSTTQEIIDMQNRILKVQEKNAENVNSLVNSLDNSLREKKELEDRIREKEAKIRELEAEKANILANHAVKLSELQNKQSQELLQIIKNNKVDDNFLDNLEKIYQENVNQLHAADKTEISVEANF